MHSHRNLLLPGAVAAASGAYGPELRQGVLLPLTILNLMVLGPLVAFQDGSALVCMDRIDAPGVAEWVRAEQVGHFAAVPTILYDLLTHPGVARSDLASLRRPEVGGAECPEEFRALYRERFGAEVTIGYGMTEAPTAVTRSDGSAAPLPGLCGRAVPQVQILIVDEKDQLAPEGEVGEICVAPAVSGPWAGVYTPMLGYWNQPEETAKALRGGVYHTGDLGFVDARGDLYIRGRRSELILRGGANVYPAEVERVLQEHPGGGRLRGAGPTRPAARPARGRGRAARGRRRGDPRRARGVHARAARPLQGPGGDRAGREPAAERDGQGREARARRAVRSRRMSRSSVGRTVAESRAAQPANPRPPAGAPNVVVVVLDDLGFAQLGCFGSDIETPTIDGLAARGLRFNRFHVTAICSPTRACLLTGRNHHAVGMGFLTDIPMGFPGYDGRIPRSAATLPRVLRDAGYATFAVGKWHLAPRWEQTASGPFERWPLGLGFERYYGFLAGDTNQWTPELVRDNGFVDAAAHARAEGYHLTEDLVDEAIRIVHDQQHATPEKPFFLYFATGRDARAAPGAAGVDRALPRPLRRTAGRRGASAPSRASRSSESCRRAPR